MKRKTIILVSFLLVLYVVPSITMSTEQNRSKDFALATEYEASDQSITSFSETLPDDVLFYPDAMTTVPRVADSGQDDYEDSFIIDATTWSADDNREYVEFDFDDTVRIERVSYSLYGCGYDDDGLFQIWNSTDWILLETLAETEEVHSWYNDTLYTEANPDYILSGNVIRLGILGLGQWFYATVDYLEVFVEYMTLADSDHYAESFANISEWVLAPAIQPTTDGDVMSWEIPNDGAWDFVYSNNPSVATGMYLEIRVKSNHTYGTTVFRPRPYSGDSLGGSSYVVTTLYPSTTWQTYKVLLTQSVECFAFTVSDTTNNVMIYLDYLRISPANESGWQHDASTTLGVSQVGGGTFSTDGDYLSLVADADGSRFDFVIDTTNTAAMIDPNYYPFLEIGFHPDDMGDWFKIERYVSGVGYGELIGQGYLTQTTARCNLLASTSDDVLYFRIWVFVSQTIRIDYVKGYSIANYTVTQSASVTVSEYLYVDSGVLKCEKSSANYLKIDYDPAISFDRITRSYWNLSLSNYVLTGGSDWKFWESGIYDHADITSGTWTGTGIMTDFAITFYSDNDFYLSALTFFNPIPQWNDAEEKTVYFHVPFDYWAFDMSLIFLGLAMIILGSLYAAYKIQNEPDRNTIVVVLLLVMFGFALFLGGIGFLGGV